MKALLVACRVMTAIGAVVAVVVMVAAVWAR